MIIFNKVDITSHSIEEKLLQNLLEQIWCNHSIPKHFIISCKNGFGVESLENGLEKHVSQIVYGNNENTFTEGILITRQRHREHLLSCLQHIDSFLNSNLPMDLAAEELRSLNCLFSDSSFKISLPLTD